MLKNTASQVVKMKQTNSAQSIHEIWKKYKDITKSVAFCSVLDLYPITSSEMQHLKDILKVIEPFYQFPSEKQLLEQIIPQLYEQVKDKVTLAIKNDLLKGVNSIAVTIDGWTGRFIADHMTITLHYWTESFEAKHYLLQLESLPKTWNTSQDLYHLIQNVLIKYGLTEQSVQSVHLTTSNGRNIVEACSMSDKWIRVPCFARLLQLAVDDVLNGFKDFNNLVGRCRLIVSALWSKTASKINSDNRKLQCDNDFRATNSNSILDDTVPSWNSVFEMFDNLLKLRVTIRAFLSNDKSVNGKLKDHTLTETDWTLMTIYVKVFSLLKQASSLMSRDSYPPLSFYLPIIRGVIELMERDANKTSLDGKISSRLIRSLCARFANVNTNESMIIAMVVDPRFKNRSLSDEERYTVFEIVKSKIVCANLSSGKDKNDEDRVEREDATALESYLSGMRKPKDAEASFERKIEAELTYYLCEDLAPMDAKIDDWWRLNRQRFPRLSELAKIYLCVPAVQVSAERAFLNKQGFFADLRASVLTEQLGVLDNMRISFLNRNVKYFKDDLSL